MAALHRVVQRSRTSPTACDIMDRARSSPLFGTFEADEHVHVHVHAISRHGLGFNRDAIAITMAPWHQAADPAVCRME